jgi:hypothetical protein
MSLFSCHRAPEAIEAVGCLNFNSALMQNYYMYYVRGYYTGAINGCLKLDELEMVASAVSWKHRYLQDRNIVSVLDTVCLR